MLKLEPETLDTYLLEMLVERRLPVSVVRAADEVEVGMSILTDPLPQRITLDAFLCELLL